MNFSSSVVATMGKDFDAIESHPLRRFRPRSLERMLE
jgi:hypothetical protein